MIYLASDEKTLLKDHLLSFLCLKDVDTKLRYCLPLSDYGHQVAGFLYSSIRDFEFELEVLDRGTYLEVRCLYE